MPRMIVTVKGGFRYAAQMCAEGDYFEATERDAKLLSGIGKAKFAPQLVRRAPDYPVPPTPQFVPPTPQFVPPAAPAVQAKALESEDAPAVEEEETSKLSLPPRTGNQNRYNRRDLKARD